MDVHHMCVCMRLYYVYDCIVTCSSSQGRVQLGPHQPAISLVDLYWIVSYHRVCVYIGPSPTAYPLRCSGSLYVPLPQASVNKWRSRQGCQCVGNCPKIVRVAHSTSQSAEPRGAILGYLCPTYEPQHQLPTGGADQGQGRPELV